MKYSHSVLTMLLLLGLAACASGPRYDAKLADTSLTASKVASSPAAHSGARVIWGGVIVITRNQSGFTEMEILSYPLDSSQRPNTRRGEQGRFIARYSRYLEGVDYAPGRLVTISGKVEKVLQGKVGDAPYTFPQIEADDVYLWPIDGRTQSSPSVHFGIGVIFGR